MTHCVSHSKDKYGFYFVMFLEDGTDGAVRARLLACHETRVCGSVKTAISIYETKN